MNQRCNNPNHVAYPYYGGRGIRICEQWKSFAAFAKDMGERQEGHTLDRIDSGGNYEPQNCRWASPSVQSTNQRRKKNNKSGIAGVFWFARTSRWMVYIDWRGTRFNLGYYEDFFEACCVRKSAEVMIWRGIGADEFVHEVKVRLAVRPNAGWFKCKPSQAISMRF